MNRLTIFCFTGQQRKQPVQAWVTKIAIINGLESEYDFTDAKLSLLQRRFIKPVTWQLIQTVLGQSILRIDDLSPQQIRYETTTVLRRLKSSESDLFQYGDNKDGPTLKQIKVMAAYADLLGLPSVSQVNSGYIANAKLNIPAVDQVLNFIAGIGLWFVDDCKMSAFEIRASIHHMLQHYLCQLAKTVKNATDTGTWTADVNTGTHLAQPIFIDTDTDDHNLFAEEYVSGRNVQAAIPRKSEPDGTPKVAPLNGWYLLTGYSLRDQASLILPRKRT